jgi:hypothetical protein
MRSRLRSIELDGRFVRALIERESQCEWHATHRMRASYSHYLSP